MNDDTPPHGIPRPRHLSVPPLPPSTMLRLERSLTRDILDDLYDLADEAAFLLNHDTHAAALTIGAILLRIEEHRGIDRSRRRHPSHRRTVDQAPPALSDCVVCHEQGAPWNGSAHVHEQCADLRPGGETW